MARGVNKVTIIGNLGADPEVRYMPSGAAITNIRVATSSAWKDRQTGEKQERTEWHRITLFNRLGEIAAQYLRKGSMVYIEGALRTNKWQDQAGNDRYSTDIIASEMRLLDRKGSGTAGSEDADYNQPMAQTQKAPAMATATAGGGPEEPFDDDIPF